MSSKAAVLAALAGIALSGIASGDARALTCYVVFDRNENVTYRDVYPPVDLSEAGRAERDAMRRRGEFLMFMEAEQCPRIEYFTGTAGTVGLQLDQTLAPSPQPPREAPAAPAAPPAPRKPAPRKG